MRELFVYYRVPVERAESAAAIVRGLQIDLAAEHPGLIARLLRRPDTSDGLQTWMETYAMAESHAPAGVDAELQAAIEAQARPLLPLLHGPRHTEVFVACAS